MRWSQREIKKVEETCSSFGTESNNMDYFLLDNLASKSING